ncbi:heterokaryon incompatibility protein-domain-containing protein [Annulohypoxylon stygium]|nr:heterokaryon incompatibility protein-domain-containing protein [Annulohypoxylon stygium]
MTSIPHDPFKYTPLNQGEIRLLYCSFEANEPTWTLKTMPLYRQASDDPISYDALSYTWGDLSRTFSFICNNQELRVHHNLHHALPHLARRRSSLPIWIDAICINQADETEKLAQVRLMHAIYRQATEVWVWLGPGSSGSEDAIALLPQIAAVGESAFARITEFPKPTLESEGLPSFSSPVWTSVYELIDHPWYSRVWIVQEAALASRIKVLQGKHEISWTMLDKAVDYAMHLPYRFRSEDGEELPTVNATNQIVFSIRETVQDPESKQKPWVARFAETLMHVAESHQCSVPEDRVFGVLGFLEEHQLKQMNLNPHKRVEVVDLFTRVTHFLLSNIDPSLKTWWELFNLAISSNKRSGLPTWCPDFHNLQGSDAPPITLEQIIPSSVATCPYYASKKTSFPSQGNNVREIYVRGKEFDYIQDHYPGFPADFGEDIPTDYLKLHAWETGLATAIFGSSPSELPCTAETPGATTNGCILNFTIDDYWRTLVGNIVQTEQHTLTYQVFAEFRQRLAEMVKLLEAGMDAVESDLNPLRERIREHYKTYFLGETPCTDYMTDLMRFMPDRRVFVTHGGRIGFGPLDVRSGDVVCTLNNARTLHVLRRVNEITGEKYLLVGQAYVHGMMNGEVENLDVEEKDFTLV